MTRRNPPMRYTLPEVVSPDDSICFQIQVPNDRFHLAAFRGAIYSLAKAYSWANDDAHTALDVAAVWMDIYDNLGACSVDTFRQYDDCTLQISHDGGATWIDLFNASACVAAGILDKLDDGTLAPGGQQPAEGPGTPGQCYTYHVKLDGNGRWQAPVQVEAGDQIVISNVQGAWYDGDLYPLGIWNCADGGEFNLGACGGGGATQGTDPLPTVDHMRLIGNIGSEAAPYFDMYNATYVVGTATPDNFFLLANDQTPADNQGSITLEVEICKDAGCPSGSTWSSSIDFRTVAGGFVALQGSRVNGIGWEQGTYFDSGAGEYYRYASIQLVLATPVQFTRVKVFYDTIAGQFDHTNIDRIAFIADSPTNRVASQTSADGINRSMGWDGARTESNLIVTTVASEWNTNITTPLTHIKSIVICGTGTKPPELP